MPQPQAAAAAAPAPTGVQPQYPHAPVAAKAQYPTAHVAAKPIVTAQPVQYVMQPQPQVNVVRTGRGGGTVSRVRVRVLACLPVSTQELMCLLFGSG